jgi:hypothetical protein
MWMNQDTQHKTPANTGKSRLNGLAEVMIWLTRYAPAQAMSQ